MNHVVPGKDYIDSIWLDVKGAKEDISNAPVYVILNLCSGKNNFAYYSQIGKQAQ